MPLGTILGYAMTFRLKKYLKSQPLDAEPVKNNLANHFLAGCIDAVAIMLIASVSAMILRVYAPAIYQISLQAIVILWWITWEWIVPKICRGWTFGRYLVGVEKRKKTAATQQMGNSLRAINTTLQSRPFHGGCADALIRRHGNQALALLPVNHCHG